MWRASLLLCCKSEDVMKYIFLVIIGLSLLACKSKSAEEQAVDAAETAYTTSPSDSTALALLQAIDQYLEKNGYLDSTAARYVVRAARVSTERDKEGDALSYYRKFLTNFPGRKDEADKLIEVYDLVTRQDNTDVKEIMFKTLAARFPDDTRAASWKEQIREPEVSVDSILRRVGATMFNDSIFRLNETRARLYVLASEVAAMADPGLASAPDHLHRAAETARTLRNPAKAIEIFDWIYQKYPEHPRGATALFLKGFVYDTDLKDFDSAGETYEAFLARFPNHDFADDAQFLLDNLGKSEQELSRMLEEKAKKEVQ